MCNNQAKQTCQDKGLEHTWERREFTEGGGALCFYCAVCTAWGWSGRFEPSRIRQYAEPFKSREPAAPLTVLTSAERLRLENVVPSEHVNRRGHRLPRKRGEYSPRFGIEDWDREPVRASRAR